MRAAKEPDTMSPAPRFVGSEVKRLEDPRLIRGQAQYVDDLTLPGLAHAWVVRSPHAHARIVRLDAAGAEKLAGVYLVLTAIVNAVVDGLAPLGVTHLDMPLRPEKLWRLMR